MYACAINLACDQHTHYWNKNSRDVLVIHFLLAALSWGLFFFWLQKLKVLSKVMVLKTMH